MQPELQPVEDGLSLGLPQGGLILWGFPPRLLLNSVEFRDLLDGLLSNGRPSALDLVDELAAHLDHAGLFAGHALAEQTIEHDEAIGMNGASVAREMTRRVLTLSIHAELVPSAGWSLPAPGALIAHVAPEPGGLGRVSAHLQFCRCIVRKKRRVRPDQRADVLGQRLQQSRCSSDPVAQREAMQIDPLTRVDPGLPIQRKVVAIFADQDVCQ